MDLKTTNSRWLPLVSFLVELKQGKRLCAYMRSALPAVCAAPFLGDCSTVSPIHRRCTACRGQVGILTEAIQRQHRIETYRADQRAFDANEDRCGPIQAIKEKQLLRSQKWKRSQEEYRRKYAPTKAMVPNALACFNRDRQFLITRAIAEASTNPRRFDPIASVMHIFPKELVSIIRDYIHVMNYFEVFHYCGEFGCTVMVYVEAENGTWHGLSSEDIPNDIKMLATPFLHPHFQFSEDEPCYTSAPRQEGKCHVRGWRPLDWYR